MMPDVIAPQEAALIAYRQLIAINLESWKPEVDAWLHSEAANEELQRLLAAVPCFGGVH